MSEAARVLVVAGHIDGGAGALEIILMLASRNFAVVLFYSDQIVFGGVAPLKARGSEEDDCVLNLFAAKTGERFLIFGEDAKDAAVGTAEERVFRREEERV